MRFHFALIHVCLACGGGTSLAQDPQGTSSEERTAVASRAASPIALDGKMLLDDMHWPVSVTPIKSAELRLRLDGDYLPTSMVSVGTSKRSPGLTTTPGRSIVLNPSIVTRTV